MKRFNLEVTVGLFVILGLLALGYLSIKLGQLQLGGGHTYTLTAVFPTVAGLKLAAKVEIAGVPIGQVAAIHLEDFEAVVTMRLDDKVRLQEDAIASIRTQGLIGEKYIRLSPGGSERLIPPGGRLREVEAPVDLEDLVGRFIQGKI
ncbi:Intermembrane phospholipid transport system binding protein MlaD [Candidatus Entotheonellaceae bacterium PAL068K]